MCWRRVFEGRVGKVEMEADGVGGQHFFFSIRRGIDRFNRQVEIDSGRYNSKGRRIYSQVQQRS
jgi:hypothetical protein